MLPFANGCLLRTPLSAMRQYVVFSTLCPTSVSTSLRFCGIWSFSMEGSDSSSVLKLCDANAR